MNIKQILTGVGLTIASIFGIGLMLSPATVYAADDLDCAFLPDSVCNAANSSDDIETSGIWALLILIIRIMTAGIGIVAVIAIVVAGFLYVTAEDSVEQTNKAKQMIMNTVIGLVSFALMWALLEYLIPGGVFS